MFSSKVQVHRSIKLNAKTGKLVFNWMNRNRGRGVPACRAHSIVSTRCRTAHQRRQRERERGKRGVGHLWHAVIVEIWHSALRMPHIVGPTMAACSALCFALLLSDSVPLLSPLFLPLSLSFTCTDENNNKTKNKIKFLTFLAPSMTFAYYL